jgi:hypothetical protein
MRDEHQAREVKRLVEHNTQALKRSRERQQLIDRITDESIRELGRIARQLRRGY